MKLIASYLTIPLIFALLVASYAMLSGRHNQASFTGLAIYSVLFYGAPYFLLAVLMVVFRAPSKLVHAGFAGISLALLLIASIWLLPPDESGLPIQWMGYWPLSLIFCFVFIGGSFAAGKYRSS
jgi:uncharacterized membrane-anchored protein YitT (DUF2179 family)